MAKQTFTTGQVLTAAQQNTLQTNDFNQTVSAKVASYVLVAADAGTRITMSNASATTITVNTGLFAAGDILFITNIGAGVCTITAGTATVSTSATLALNQFTEGILYFSSTGVALFNRYAQLSSTYSAKTATYNFVSGDEGNIFSMNNAVTQQFNIPTDATFNFAVGTEFNVFWITGAGQPTIGATTPATTTVISTGATSATPKFRVVNSGATCKKLAANSWIVFGDVA